MPLGKQRKDESIESAQSLSVPFEEHITGILVKMIGTKLEELANHLKSTISAKMSALEEKFENLKKNEGVQRR